MVNIEIPIMQKINFEFENMINLFQRFYSLNWELGLRVPLKNNIQNAALRFLKKRFLFFLNKKLKN